MFASLIQRLQHKASIMGFHMAVTEVKIAMSIPALNSSYPILAPSKASWNEELDVAYAAVRDVIFAWLNELPERQRLALSVTPAELIGKVELVFDKIREEMIENHRLRAEISKVKRQKAAARKRLLALTKEKIELKQRLETKDSQFINEERQLSDQERIQQFLRDCGEFAEDEEQNDSQHSDWTTLSLYDYEDNEIHLQEPEDDLDDLSDAVYANDSTEEDSTEVQLQSLSNLIDTLSKVQPLVNKIVSLSDQLEQVLQDQS